MARSITTSPGFVAHVPSCRRNGVSRGGVLGSRPTPKYGPVPTGLPSVPMICAVSVMSPTAVFTPGVARTRASSATAIVGAVARMSEVWEPLNAVFVTTTASVPS